MRTKIVKEYTNGEITVRWKPDECIHATTCFKMLPEVFKPAERPWVKINAASTEKIIETVEACPTDALTWWYNDSNRKTEKKYFKMAENKEKAQVKIFENGPMHIHANVDVVDANGKILKVNEDKYICRCGHSKNKPFCDGSHMTAGFKG
ncbi:MAG: hypothetical protein C0596_08140 [Marinilabiliales bacterium]|nr:MAG: hypothetical protein C0596_08140 [Marinilabiliales bacterium]